MSLWKEIKELMICWLMGVVLTIMSIVGALIAMVAVSAMVYWMWRLFN